MVTHQNTQIQEHDDYHGHPNYILTWGILLLIFGLSLAAGMIGNITLAVTLIFGMAIVKIMFVVTNFMHLRYEPKSIWFTVGFGLACAFIFYYGILPDILWVPLEIAK